MKHAMPVLMVAVFIATATLADRLPPPPKQGHVESSRNVVQSQEPQESQLTTLEGEVEVLTSDLGEFFVLHTAQDNRVVELKTRNVDGATLLQRSLHGHHVRVRGVKKTSARDHDDNQAFGKDGEYFMEGYDSSARDDDAFDVIDIVDDDVVDLY